MIGRLGSWVAWLSATAVAWSAGCGHFHSDRNPNGYNASSVSLQPATITLPQWKLDGLPDAIASRKSAKLSMEDRRLGRAVEPAWCEQRAADVAAGASLAKFEDQIGANSLAEITGPLHKKKDRLEKLILNHAAWEAQSKQATAALEALYRLAEVQAKRSLLALCLDDLEVAFADAERIRDKGFTTDLEPLRSRRDEIWHAAYKLQAAEAGLNAQLRSLLKIDDACDDSRLIAAIDWTVLPLPPESMSNCNDGCGGRTGVPGNQPTLRFLSEVEASVDADTLPIVRRYIRSIQPHLGTTASIPGLNLFQRIVLRWVPIPAVKHEIELRRKQIANYRDDRGRQLAGEAAAYTAELASLEGRLALEKDSFSSAKARFEQSAQRHRDGVTSRIEMTLAKLVMADSEQRIIGLIADYKVSQTKLRASRGEIPAQSCSDTKDVGKKRRGIFARHQCGREGAASQPMELIDGN